MTTATTNLLEWIDERIKEISLSDPMPCFPVTRIEELNRIKTRILQEVENEKAVIKDAYINGTTFVSNSSMTTRRQKRRRATEYYLSIQTTFNPNNDER